MDTTLLALIASLLFVQLIYSYMRANDQGDLIVVAVIAATFMVPTLIVAAIFFGGAHGLAQFANFASANSTGHTPTVGSTMTLSNGQDVQVTHVYADGSFDVAPITPQGQATNGERYYVFPVGSGASVTPDSTQ